MLHRLAELDEVVRAGYDAFDFKRVTRALIDFMVVELSAFYFDIRKDALYCDAPSSLRRKAAVQVVRASVRLPGELAGADAALHHGGGLARPLPGRAVRCISSSSRQIAGRAGGRRAGREMGARSGRCAASSPARWRSSAPRRRSARRWRRRRVVHVADPELRRALDGVDLAEIAITSGIEAVNAEPPAGAFTLDEVRASGSSSRPAQGQRNARAPGASPTMSAPIRNSPTFRRATPRALHELGRASADAFERSRPRSLRNGLVSTPSAPYCRRISVRQWQRRAARGLTEWDNWDLLDENS